MPDGTPSENASEFMRQRPLAMQIRCNAHAEKNVRCVF